MGISDATSQPMPVMMQEVVAVPEESTPTRMEQMLNDVRDKIISYGYEPEVVEGWMMETGEEWQALDQKQTEEAMSLHQGQVQEAADYMKPILDAMIADMKAEHAAAQAEFEAQMDAHIAEMRAEANAQAEEGMATVDQW